MAKALSCSLEEPEFHPRAHGQCLKAHPQESTSREKRSLDKIEMGATARAGEKSVSPEVTIQRRERNKRSRRSGVSQLQQGQVRWAAKVTMDLTMRSLMSFTHVCSHVGL